MSDNLGDRMKSYEMEIAGRKLLPLVPAMARIDGRSFSSFTRGMERPYDARFSALMVETTKYLVQETNANMGYTQSDEITLTWLSTSPASEILFNGRIQKMESVLAGMTTAFFITALSDHRERDKMPHFDARVWSVPNKEEGANTFLWREFDATKNSISMAAQAYFSHKELMNKHGGDMQEMLFQKGINWNDYPDFFKRGSYIQRRKTLRKFSTDELDKLPPLHEARNNPELVIERTDYRRIDMPVFSKVTNRAEVVYDGAEPMTATLWMEERFAESTRLPPDSR